MGEAHRDEWTRELNLAAMEAIERIEYLSQLRDSWEDDGEEEEWHLKIEKLRGSLQRNQ